MDYWMNEGLVGGNIFDFFEKWQPMSGEEIASELNTSRQHVSQLLKRIMEKIYNRERIEHKELTPFEVANHIQEILGVNQRDESEVKKFYKLFPPKIRAQIESDGREWKRKYYR